jgi:hypothetical protein
MITMRRQLLGLGFIAASSLVALHAAQAMSGPTAIQIDGGPLGALQISGGIDGYGYYLGDTTESGNLPGTNKSLGADVANGLIEVQKTDGELQFTVEVGSNGGAVTLGAGAPGQTSISTFTTGPLYAGYITVAPSGLPVTFSAGQIGSLEGWESGIDWNNANQLTTEIFYVQNSQSRGVSANYTQGPINATVTFGDGYDTGVWNFIQGLITYTINPTNSVSVYTADNLGTTGLAAYGYGGGTVGSYGPEFVNSDMIGGFYSYTMGNLNLVPEVQYQIAKGNSKLGIGTTDPNTGVFYSKASSNLGAAIFADYSLSSTSPYSLGAWVEYWNSKGTASWFIGSDSEGIGASLTPTWQYKDVFARADAGYVWLLHNKAADGVTTYGYGDNKDHGEFVGTLEAGLLF